MEDFAEALAPIAFFGFIAFLVWLRSGRKQAEKQMLFETQKQILDKLGSGPELIQFLTSAEGRQFFDRLREPENSRGMNALGWVGGTMVWGLVATGVGVGFFLATRVLVDPGLYLPAGIFTGAGIGLLIAAAISYRLSRKWGIIEKETSEGPGARAS